ncbi:MAG TPA: HEPN domain-containing protein, partial [Spirochaetota bacterium]|nr:HEPN domain-containing protein [Spirochaetota bacterium]
MEREKLIEYWLNSSDRDYITMENLFKSTDYHWSLFIGHLVIEKLFK